MAKHSIKSSTGKITYQALVKLGFNSQGLSIKVQPVGPSMQEGSKTGKQPKHQGTVAPHSLMQPCGLFPQWCVKLLVVHVLRTHGMLADWPRNNVAACRRTKILMNIGMRRAMSLPFC